MPEQKQTWYFKGGESVERTWRDRVAEQQRKIAIAEAASQEANKQLQEEIKKNYLEGNEDGYMGAGWLYDDPDHNWQEEDCYVVVLGPYKVEFCDEQGEVIREVKLLTNDEWLKAYEKAGSYVSKDSALNNV